MSAAVSSGVVWAGEVYGSSDGERGFSCMAHLSGGPCRAEVGLCDLCMMYLYCLLEVFVPALIPAMDAAADDDLMGVRQDIDHALLAAVGLTFETVEPIRDEGHAWELLSEFYPEVRTTLDLAEKLRGVVFDQCADPAAAVLARDLYDALVRAEAILRGVPWARPSYRRGR